MKTVVTLFFVLLSGHVFANGDMYIDCNSSPKGAILTLPKPAGMFGRVSCTKYGHIIQPIENDQHTIVVENNRCLDGKREQLMLAALTGLARAA